MNWNCPSLDVGGRWRSPAAEFDGGHGPRGDPLTAPRDRQPQTPQLRRRNGEVTLI